MYKGPSDIKRISISPPPRLRKQPEDGAERIKEEGWHKMERALSLHVMLLLFSIPQQRIIYSRSTEDWDFQHPALGAVRRDQESL